MGLRFRKSVRLIPGVRLNLGLRGASLSVGGKGFTYNVSTRGSRVTAGLPGAGLSYSIYTQAQQTAQSVAASPSLSPPAQSSKSRFSATPIVITAFVFGLIYLAASNRLLAPNSAPESVATRPQSSDASPIQLSPTTSEALAAMSVPLPRPRPKQQLPAVGAPLQLVPQQQR